MRKSDYNVLRRRERNSEGVNEKNERQWVRVSH